MSRWRGPGPVPSRCEGLQILGNWKCEGHIQGNLPAEHVRGARELVEVGLPVQLSLVACSLVHLDSAEVSPEGCGLEAAPLISFLSSAI